MDLYEKYRKIARQAQEPEQPREPVNVAYRIYSEALGCYLWLTEKADDAAALRKHVDDPVYSGDEIRRLRGVDRGTLRAAHEAKKIIEDGVIENVERRRKRR